jgi:hypothetical protein
MMLNFRTFRLMADEGMNILFVPFLTDTQNAYTRVKHCAQARAIENMLRGNSWLWKSSKGEQHGYSIRTIQAVFTPSILLFQVTESNEATPRK